MKKSNLLLMLVLSSLMSFGQITTITGSGNWDDVGIWSGGNIGDLLTEDVVYNNNQSATVRTGFTYQVGNLTFANNNGLAIQTGASLTIGDSLNPGTVIGGNGATVIVDGDFVIWGDFDVQNNLTLIDQGHVEIKGDFIAQNNAIINITGDVIIDGNLEINNNASVYVDGLLYVNDTLFAGTNNILTGPGIIIIGGPCYQGNGSNLCQNAYPAPLSNPSSCGLGLSIPDSGAAINNCRNIPIEVTGVSGTSLGTDVTLAGIELIIQHARDADLDISLRSPSGVVVDLSSDNGGAGANYGDPSNCPDDVTRFRDGALSITGGSAPFVGTYSPEQSLALFNDGSDPNGIWILIVCDDDPAVVGTVEYFELTFGQHVWTGTTSTDWSTGSNWSDGVVPNSACSTLDVLIPEGLTNYPVLTSSIDINSIYVEENASVTIPNGLWMTVCEEFSHYGNNSTGPGTLIFDNNVQAQPVLVRGNFEAGAVWVATKSGFDAIVTGGSVMTIDSCLQMRLFSRLAIASTADVILASDADGTAYLDNFTFINNTIIGNITQQRLVRNTGAGSGFYYLSNPVQSPSVADWRDDFNTDGFQNGAYVGPTTLNGAQVIPDPACLVNNLAPGSPYGGLFSFDESAVTGCILEGWHVKSDGALVPGGGYAGIVPDGVTLEVTGAPNPPNVSVPITRTGTNTTQPGLNMVGNPYMSAIDWASVVGNNAALISGTAYFWQSTGYYSGVTLPLNMMISGQIPSMQGFQVEALSSGNLNFFPSHRVAGDPSFSRTAPLYDQRIDLVVEGNGFADITYLTFSGLATNGFDILYDSRKGDANEFQPRIWTNIAGEKITINSFDQFDGNEVIPVSMAPGANGTYTIKAEQMETFDPTALVFLRDKQTGAVHCFNFDGNYSFTSNVNDAPARFELFFNPAIEATTAKADCDDLNGTLSFDLGNVSWDSYEVIDAQGNVVKTATQVSGVVSHNDMSSGQYTIEVSFNGNIISIPAEVDGSTPVAASFATDFTTYEVGEAIQFTNTSAGANGYVWNFGDGTLMQGVSDPVYSFTKEGSYLVQLESSNNDCIDFYSSWITVSNKATGLLELVDGIGIKAFTVGAKLVVDFDQPANQDFDIRLYDLAGALVMDAGKHRNDVNIETGLNTGVYILEITGAHDKISRKLPIGF